ncbi:YbaB/EbfC family nucleoid-associated protein [Actinoplanes sp. TBRC 11911]|uniref:YbaB/EbfC family nucleoid-associated protein n=1 Tax=Actinoplanes sp. TBRC 11911 TaxID=2729386 RepID=UPI00145E0018|nr:YbaB/EbfC family nucleoid-associated protein [Actinoplanes sp. TBRC 11911]NMO57581.1 YbaB/EbfC family nucleoid-associated protein [Actinoplanes sp. TBRC 11911]
MLDDTALNAGDRWIDDWQAKIEARLARTRALTAGLREVKGVGRSGDGLVEVTIDSSGALMELRLDEDVRRHSARWIAEQVITAARSAKGDLARAATGVVHESGENETPEGRAVLAAFTARLGESGG